ncbi:MAG: acyltransferase [Betaproteobacteria bacterium]
MKDFSWLRTDWRLDLRDPNAPNGFDALRFFAASIVLLGHSWPLTGRTEPPLGGWDTLAGIGVAIFFVISGFLVAASRERSSSVTNFLHKRVLRILPALLFVCLVAVFILGPVATTLPLGAYFDHPQTRAYFGNLTMFDIDFALPGVFASNFHPLAVNGSIWTLPIEIFMYLLLAVGSWLLLDRWRILGVIVIAMIAWQWKGLEWVRDGAHLWTTLPLYYTVKFGIFFALGTAAYLWRDKLPLSPVRAVVLWVVTWLAGPELSVLPYMVALAYSTLLIAVLPWSALTRFGQRGDFSYGMYLFAFPVQQTMVHYGGAALPLPANIMICFLITLFCAAISWHWIEQPWLQMKSGAHVR